MFEENFKYLVEGPPIDYFLSTLSKEELIKSNIAENHKYQMDIDRKFEETVIINHSFIKNIVKEKSGEVPHTIRYFSIPSFDCCEMEICAVAKITNNGSTFIFTNNREFIEFISSKSGYGLNIVTL